MKDARATVGNILEALEAALGPEEVWETVGRGHTVFHHACLLLLLAHTVVPVADPSGRGDANLPYLK